jgi:hypothetical protein
MKIPPRITHVFTKVDEGVDNSRISRLNIDIINVLKRDGIIDNTRFVSCVPHM